jgi:hypothetical protein
MLCEPELSQPGRADNQVRAGHPACHPAVMPVADVRVHLP